MTLALRIQQLGDIDALIFIDEKHRFTDYVFRERHIMFVSMCPFQNQQFRSWLCKPFGDMPSLGFISKLVASKQSEVTRRQVMGFP